MYDKKRHSILIIGALPPTIGGISIHIQRLAEFASQQNITVTVCDLFSRNRLEKDRPKGAFAFSGRGFRGKLRLLAHLLAFPNVTHLHLSSGSNAFLLFLLTVISAVCSRTISTIHSGSFPDEYRQMSWLRKSAVMKSLQRCEVIICVSQRIADFVIGIGIPAYKVRVIPAFIPPSSGFKGIALSGKTDLLRACASGFATPLYEWHTLLDAIEISSSTCQYHFAFYNQYQQPYFDELRQKLSKKTNVQVHTDLSPTEFTNLLNACDIFIRPTTTDGDSIALREAMFLGKEVIASDAVPRPDNCLLFATSNASDLANKIDSVVKRLITGAQRPSMQIQDAINSTGDAICSIYLNNANANLV